jgi:NADPH-dependent 2,4-dienoyl-CoA reductase/sulfur reductase-like enzyme
MPYYIGGLVDGVDSLIARTPEQFWQRGIQAHTRHDVEAIDVQNRQISVRDLTTGSLRLETFDHLVIATGAAPLRPKIPGIDIQGVHSMSSIRDMLEIEHYLEENDCQHAVIVGGGYIGLEMAEAFQLRGMDVTLIHSRSTLMPTLDEDMGLLVNEALAENGVELILNQRASQLEHHNGRVTGVVAGAKTHRADIVVLAIGTKPRAQLADDAGIPTGKTGGIIVNERMETSIEGIWAAGDCTETVHLVSGKKICLALGTIANKQGRVCGINLGGGQATFPGVLATAITRFGDLEIARTGLSETELIGEEVDYVAGRINSSTRSGYFPGSSKITVKITAERKTGRILGGQIVGGSGAGKRIDTIATAIAAGMTVLDLEYLDLSYAPPFSPVWDPVQIAARIAGQQR